MLEPCIYLLAPGRGPASRGVVILSTCAKFAQSEHNPFVLPSTQLADLFVQLRHNGVAMCADKKSDMTTRIMYVDESYDRRWFIHSHHNSVRCRQRYEPTVADSCFASCDIKNA